MGHEATAERYDRMTYRRTGRSGLELPADLPRPVAQLRRRPALRRRQRAILRRAFDLRRHALRPGQQLRAALRRGRDELRPASWPTTSRPYRDELVISTKAGYDMWPGPYGERRLPQVPAGQPRPVAERGWAWTTSTSSTPTAPTRRRRSRRRWARWTRPSARARRSTPASPRTRRSGPREAAAILRGSGRRC